MVLMKLWLNLYDQDLACRFRIHQSTVSRKTTKWIEAMFVRLQSLIRWPGREELLNTMPFSFKAHSKQCVVGIDCFEVFVGGPRLCKQEHRHGPIINIIIQLSF